MNMNGKDKATIKEIQQLLFKHNFGDAIVWEYVEKISEQQVLLIMQNIVEENETREKRDLNPISPGYAFRNFARHKEDEQDNDEREKREFENIDRVLAQAKKESETLRKKGFIPTNESLAKLLMDWYEAGTYLEDGQPKVKNINDSMKSALNFLDYTNAEILGMGIAVTQETLDI